MLFEWRTYHFAPGKALAYLEAFRADGLALVTRHLPMLGYWLTECGRLNVLHHLWVYDDLEHRSARRASLAGDAAWTEGFGPRAFPMIERQETLLLTLKASSPELDLVVRDALQVRVAPTGPILAPTWAMMELADGPTAVGDGVAAWTVVAGERPGATVTLRRWDSAPKVTDLATGPRSRRELMRPCSFSPLR